MGIRQNWARGIHPEQVDNNMMPIHKEQLATAAHGLSPLLSASKSLQVKLKVKLKTTD
jgi:hypothetical protein